MRIRVLVDAVVGSSSRKDTWDQATAKLRPVLRAVTFGAGPGLQAAPLVSRPVLMVEEQYRDAPRAISPVGYTVDDRGVVVPYSAPAGSDLASVVHRAEILLAAREYAAQQDALDAAHQRTGTDIFVGSMPVVDRPGTPTTSIAVWPDDVDSLLPCADLVAFPPPGDAGAGSPLTVPFEVVAREASLVSEPDYAPPRFHVTRWPDPAVMDRLRAHALDR